MSKTTQTKKHMRLAMAVIINSRESAECNLKGLAKAVWEIYAKHQVPDMPPTFNAFYKTAKVLNSNFHIVVLDDPRIDQTIAQYAQRQIALDLAKNSSLYSAAKDAFELFRRLGVKGGYNKFGTFLRNLKRERNRGKIGCQL